MIYATKLWINLISLIKVQIYFYCFAFLHSIPDCYSFFCIKPLWWLSCQTRHNCVIIRLKLPYIIIYINKIDVQWNSFLFVYILRFFFTFLKSHIKILECIKMYHNQLIKLQQKWFKMWESQIQEKYIYIY